nr:ATPase subunits 8 [Polyipnus polli]
MPQLNPAPWFSILLLSWFFLLTVIPPIVLAHTSLNDPALDPEQMKTEPWNWPWL